MTLLAPSLFAGRATALPPDVTAGLELLEGAPPLWPVELDEWLRTVARVRAFAEAWHARARAAGWTALELYGLHCRASYARLSAIGAAWLLARSGDQALRIDSDAILVGTRGGGRLRIYRMPPDPDAVLAWTLCGAAAPRNLNHARV